MNKPLNLKEILKKLRKTGEEERSLETPDGRKRFRITHYLDQEGNEIIEIKGLETDDYILIPKQVLKQILNEAAQGEGGGGIKGVAE